MTFKALTAALALSASTFLTPTAADARLVIHCNRGPIPSNPMIALYQLHFAGFGAIPGHIGFDKVELTEERTMDSHAYIHYLHHKYFEVNYCDDGVLPWDKWFGTWHDGTRQADDRMKERFRRKRERTNRRTAAVPAE